jgi:hypothetical protein
MSARVNRFVQEEENAQSDAQRYCDSAVDSEQVGMSASSLPVVISIVHLSCRRTLATRRPVDAPSGHRLVWVALLAAFISVHSSINNDLHLREAYYHQAPQHGIDHKSQRRKDDSKWWAIDQLTCCEHSDGEATKEPQPYERGGYCQPSVVREC